MEIRLRQVRSANGVSPTQRETLRSLSLGRIGRRSSHPDSPQFRGMLRVVEHLVAVEEGKAGDASKDAMEKEQS